MINPKTLNTSLDQIKSFNPCQGGWKTILEARRTIQNSAGPVEGMDYALEFPLVECVESNSISDVCWLLGKLERKEILVSFARKCADSVAHLGNNDSRRAADYAAADAAYAAAAADAADAAADAAAYESQKQLNKSFLIQSIQEFEASL